MRARLKQWTAVSVLVLVAGSALVGCGDKDDGKAGSGSNGTTLTRATFFDETAQAQKKAGTSHVKLSVKAAGQTIKADGDLKVGAGPADTAMAMTMQTGQAGLGTLEMRLVNRVFYLNFGPMTQNKFAKIDLTDPDNPIGKQFGEIAGNLDPAQQLKEFKGAVSSFDQKGEVVTLDGVKATPYVIGVDTAKLPAAKKASMPKTLEYTMYVGPDNLPRRVLAQLPGLGGSGSGNTMTIDYSHWGEKVSIAKPKASEVTDQDFLSQLGGASPSPS
jgi:hypothetical protein